MENKKQTKFVNYTPVGTLEFPRLNKPDEFRGKKSFQTQIVLDKSNADVQDFLDKLDTHVLSKLKDGDYRPIKIDGDKVTIKVKRNADFGAPSFYEPKSEGKGFDKLEKAPGLVWSGTKASLGFTTYEYDGGVSFNLVSVAVHELVEPENKTETAPAKKPELKKRKVNFS